MASGSLLLQSYYELAPGDCTCRELNLVGTHSPAPRLRGAPTRVLPCHRMTGCSTIASRTRGLYTQRMAGLLQSLKCCLNPKVLVGLGAGAVAVLVLAPNLVASAFPLLLALVCPLSMLVMMGSMARMGKQ